MRIIEKFEIGDKELTALAFQNGLEESSEAEVHAWVTGIVEEALEALVSDYERSNCEESTEET